MGDRYSLATSLGELLPHLQGPWPPGLQAYYAPRLEVCPGEPVLLQRQEHGRLQVGLALWGLLPEWAKDPAEARRPISAQSETVNEKVSFRGAWRHRRCLLPADAFFEWGGAPKRPYRFARRDGAPFWIGGIWERWIGPDGSELDTCCILTTEPNGLVRPIHGRMPVVIPMGLEEPWLAMADGPGLRALEPLMAPWDPADWQVTQLDMGI